jgi:hypothetical protein
LLFNCLQNQTFQKELGYWTRLAGFGGHVRWKIIQPF